MSTVVSVGGGGGVGGVGGVTVTGVSDSVTRGFTVKRKFSCTGRPTPFSAVQVYVPESPAYVPIICRSPSLLNLYRSSDLSISEPSFLHDIVGVGKPLARQRRVA